MKMKTSSSVRDKDLRKRYNLSHVTQCYLMIGIPLIGFAVFIVYPYIWTAVKSWYYYTGIENSTKFVGWDNFISAFKDATYWHTWLTTLKLLVVKLPLELPFALLLAVILNGKIKGKGFFRTMYFMPNVVSIAILGLIVTNMFDYFGYINGILMKFHIIKEEIEWFGNTYSAIAALVIGSIWNSFGINVMYFIAALANIPEELYESANLDGAGRFTIFFRITLPLMSPVLQTILLLALNGCLHTCDYILVTTQGAPGGTTFTVMSYIVSRFVPGFAENNVNIGYGCALALMTSAIMCMFAVLHMRLTKKMNEIY